MRSYFIMAFLLLPLIGSPATERPFIKASDVVFMYAPREASQMDAYRGTVVGWGGRPSSREENAVVAFRRRVEEAHRHGLRYCGSVDFLVDFGGFIDMFPDRFREAACRDLDGNALRVPWLWDHQHKGEPAYWFCTNHPDVREYLFDQVERACLAPIDGLHIDDYSGTSACSDYLGGCFCPHCMKGFRDYLQRHYSAAQLAERGIAAIESFDYGVFLKEKGITAAQYKSKSPECPLRDEFQVFQNESMKARITEMFERAEALRHMPLVRSINSSASSPRTLIPAPIIDYFCGEVDHHAASQAVPPEPVMVYKIVESLGRRQTATASGQDWAWIKANEKPGLVRTWIAQTYAFGSVFMAPHHQWCYTQELGTHWWDGKPEDFADLFQFVADHRALLDDYQSLADTVLIYTRAGYSTIRNAAARLTEANVPYTIQIAGDAELPGELSGDALSTYSNVIVAENSPTNERRERWTSAQVKILEWKDLESLPVEITHLVEVKGDAHVRISLRYNPRRPEAPLVCHVLNQHYDPSQDRVIPGDVQIILHKDLLERTHKSEKAAKARVHRPGSESTEIPLEIEGDGVSFQILNAGVWTLVEW